MKATEKRPKSNKAKDIRFCKICGMPLSVENPNTICRGCQKEATEKEARRKKGGRPTHLWSGKN